VKKSLEDQKDLTQRRKVAKVFIGARRCLPARRDAPRRPYRRCALFILLLLSVACGSHQPAKQASSLPSSAEQDKKAAQQPAQKQEQKTISYATNPERFVKEKTYEPPFNITNPKTAQEHFNVAVNDDHHNQLDKAIEEYNKALELKPDWALAHFRLAQDYNKQGRTDDAITHWEKATQYDPRFYSAYDLLAGAYQRQGNLKKAIQAYSGLLKYPPAQMMAHYQLGLWYAELGDRQKARGHLESYWRLAGNTPEQQSPRFRKALQELQKLK
jgi:tetratricopeptide (TPR) repeat protein